MNGFCAEGIVDQGLVRLKQYSKIRLSIDEIGKKAKRRGKRNQPAFCPFSILDQASFNETVRLKTRLSGEVSGSTQK